MEKSNVTFYGDDIATVQKYMSPTILVMKYNNMVFISDPTVRVNDQPFVALFKYYTTAEEAYNKWLYLVGKMCKKNSDSKYFNNHNVAEYFNNGDAAEEEWKSEIACLVDRAWHGIVCG